MLLYKVTCSRPAGHAAAASEACDEQVQQKLGHFLCSCGLQRELQKCGAAMGSVTLQHKATHAVWLESFTRGSKAYAERGGGSGGMRAKLRRSNAKRFALNRIAQKPGALAKASFHRWVPQECRRPRARVPSASQAPLKFLDVLGQRL